MFWVGTFLGQCNKIVHFPTVKSDHSRRVKGPGKEVMSNMNQLNECFFLLLVSLQLSKTRKKVNQKQSGGALYAVGCPTCLTHSS